MKEFKIIHKERLVGVYHIKADNVHDAVKKYWDMVISGEIDYTDMDVIDSSDEVEEVEQ